MFCRNARFAVTNWLGWTCSSWLFGGVCCAEFLAVRNLPADFRWCWFQVLNISYPNHLLLKLKLAMKRPQMKKSSTKLLRANIVFISHAMINKWFVFTLLMVVSCNCQWHAHTLWFLGNSPFTVPRMHFFLPLLFLRVRCSVQVVIVF